MGIPYLHMPPHLPYNVLKVNRSRPVKLKMANSRRVSCLLRHSVTFKGLRPVLFACAIWLLSCSDDTKFVPIYDVPAEWQPFIERFEQEATARGVTLDITNIVIQYDGALDESLCGQCNSLSMDKRVQKIISINPTAVCWFTEEAKEAFIFHELGHCILGREHDPSLLPNDSPKSIMTPNNLIIYVGCQYPIDGDNTCDHRYRRTYYLDELFDPTTPVPDWGK